MLGIFMMLSESAVPGAVPPLTLINYIVDASGLTELNWPSLDLPVIGQVGGRVELVSRVTGTARYLISAQVGARASYERRNVATPFASKIAA